MELLYKNIEQNDNHTILGSTSQVLQILLKKGDCIVTKKNNIYYLSSQLEDVENNKKHLLDESLEPMNESVYGYKLNDKNLVRLTNKSSILEYVGLSNGGRIMKILPIFYNDLYIRYDNLLAFSNNIDIRVVNSTKREMESIHYYDSVFFKEHVFYLILASKLNKINTENVSLSDYQWSKDAIYLNNESIFLLYFFNRFAY